MDLRSGKLPLEYLEEILALRGAEDPDVRLGPAIGEDAGAVRVGESYVVSSTDPVTYAREGIGWYAVHVNANDVATRGVRPRWFQATLLFPRESTMRAVQGVARQVHEACRELDVAIIGGHTEVTAAVSRVVVSGAMLGVVARDRLVTTGGARKGDDLLLTKGAGIEGTALLARDRREELRQVLGQDVVERAEHFLQEPGLSVVKEALLGAKQGAHAMHDPTEGGVAMGLHEMSVACEHVLEVRPSSIPVPEETEAISAHYGLNPFGLLASGALLLAIAPEGSSSLLTRLRRMGVPATRIGRVGAPGRGIAVTGESPHPFEPLERDEIARVLSD